MGVYGVEQEDGGIRFINKITDCEKCGDKDQLCRFTFGVTNTHGDGSHVDLVYGCWKCRECFLRQMEPKTPEEREKWSNYFDEDNNVYYPDT